MAVRGHQVQSIIDRHVVLGQLLDLVHLVRRAEAVEEMEERARGIPASRAGRSGPCPAPLAPSAEQSIAQPVERPAITSLWSPKIDRACVATDRAATWKTVGVNSPAILNMFGIISSRPCEAVNVVVRAPGLKGTVDRAGRTGLALHLDDSGTVPKMFVAAGGRPGVGQLAHGRTRA